MNFSNYAGTSIQSIGSDALVCWAVRTEMMSSLTVLTEV
jgi:hypothetical protein